MAGEEQDKDFRELDEQLSKIEQELSAPDAARKIAANPIEELCRWYCILRPYIQKASENPKVPEAVRRLLRFFMRILDLICKCDQRTQG